MAFDASKKNLYERNFWLFLKEVMTPPEKQCNLTRVHKEWCDALQADYGERRRKMYLKPRGTYKTSIYVIAFACWIFIRDPDRTALLVSVNGEKAGQNYRAIRTHLRENRQILACWGRVWDNQRGRFTNNGIWQRFRDPSDVNHHTPNLRSAGMGASLTGQHYDTIFCDDIVSEKDRDSPTERENTKNYFRRLQPILNDDAPGEIIVVGTRWHFDDLYHHIEFDLNQTLKGDRKYICEIEALYEMDKDAWLTRNEIKYITDPETGKFVLRFPEKYDDAAIDGLQNTMGLPDFYAQYLNNPTPSEATGFPRENMVLFDMKDMAAKIKDLDVITYWDPATSERDTLKVCYSALVTVGLDRKESIAYVLGATLMKMDTVEGVERAREHIQAFSPRVFAYEASGDPVLLEKELRYMLLNAGLMTKTRLRKVPTYHGGASKDARIEMMSNLYDLGFLRFRSDWQKSGRWKSYRLLIEQLVHWPLHTFKDGPDALAGCIEVLDIPRANRGVRVRAADGRYTKSLRERVAKDGEDARGGHSESRQSRARRQRDRSSMGLDTRLRGILGKGTRRRR
jgi:hypothetical protein